MFSARVAGSDRCPTPPLSDGLLTVIPLSPDKKRDKGGGGDRQRRDLGATMSTISTMLLALIFHCEGPIIQPTWDGHTDTPKPPDRQTEGNHKDPPLPLPSIDGNGGPATSLPVPTLGCMDGYLVGRATSGRKLAGRTARTIVW